MIHTTRFRGRLASLLGVAALGLTSLHAQLREPAPPTPAGEYEEPPILAAETILRPEYLKGPNFSVNPGVPTYAGHNQYVIQSDFGVFEADGNAQLTERVAEIRAIARLHEISRSDVYQAALEKSASGSVALAKNLAKNPVKTISGVPKGLWKYVNRAGQSVKEATEERERSPYEDSAAKDLIGFSKVKRDISIQLGVDPYSSNPMLQKELNGIAWAAYGGSTTIQAALAPVGGGAGAAITAFNVTESTTQALRDQSPNDLRRAALEQFKGMGMDHAGTVVFLNNPAYTPTAQTFIVAALESLRGVSGRGEFIKLASEVSDHADALFFQRCAQLMAAVNARMPLAAIVNFRGLPIGLGKDGTAIVALEWDYASWTEAAARFVHELQGAEFGQNKVTGCHIVITGAASPRVREELAKLKIQLTEKALPGPLR